MISDWVSLGGTLRAWCANSDPLAMRSDKSSQSTLPTTPIKVTSNSQLQIVNDAVDLRSCNELAPLCTGDAFSQDKSESIVSLTRKGPTL